MDGLRSNQIWTRTSSGQLTVYSGSSLLCLGASGNQATAGTKVEILSCNGGAGEQWNVNSNGASTGNGALVELWTCNGQSNQQWTLG